MSLTPEIIARLLEQGMTQADIAKEYGVSRQFVWKVKTQGGLDTRTPRQVAMESFPWRGQVSQQLWQGRIAQNVSNHAEYMATGGEGMSHEQLRPLRSFYRYLKDNGVVVEFHPNIPPNEHAKNGGWTYRPRRASDGELIIRVNDLAQMTDVAHEIWKFPPMLPEDRG